MNAQNLPLGRVVATPGALALLERHEQLPEILLARHRSGDWGTLDPEDRQANEAAIRDGLRVLSSYPVGEEDKLWIITEWDRSATTLLLPSEY